MLVRLFVRDSAFICRAAHLQTAAKTSAARR